MDLLNFEPIREDWNILELEDETVVRLRPVLLFVYANDGQDKGDGFGVRWSLQMGVWSPEKGDPTEGAITNDRIRDSLTETNLSYRFLNRGESAYQVDGLGRLLLQLMPVRFDRTDLYDGDREPVYRVDSETQMTVEGEDA